MASWHVEQLKYAFGLGGLFSFYGIIFFIVYYMPASTAAYNTKIVIVAAVLLTLPFALIGAYVASRRQKKKEKAEAAAAAAEAGTEAAEAPQKAAKVAPSEEISGGIEETVQFLKASNLADGGKDAIYSLPWYIVAGAQNSGKSSLVLASNLNFQTLSSQRQSEQKFIRPTGSVDWRVTSEAVFLDTAGRFQNEGPDAEEWSSILESLKKYRGARPLDGILLAVDAGRLIKADDHEIEEMAKNQRARLDDAMQRLKVKFPIYLVFTNADSIEGFRDSFSASKNEGKTLVWGATFPLDKAENAQSMFDSEYDLLHTALMKRRVLRLSAPFPPVRQLRIFNFPLHFGSARRKLGTFVSALFRPSPFSANPFLRGFYFVADPPAKGDRALPGTVGNTYFAERFFRDVLLRDKDLVATQEAQKKAGPVLGWIITTVIGLAVAFLLIMSIVSTVNNKRLLDNAKAKGEQMLKVINSDDYKKSLSDPKTAKDSSIKEEMNAMNGLLSALVELDDYERNSPPWYFRFGLYSGDGIYRDYLLVIYNQVIQRRFKDPAVAAVEGELKKFASSTKVLNASNLAKEDEDNLDSHYDLLKAYLMLAKENNQYVNADDIVKQLTPYWTAGAKLPPDLQAQALDHLKFWAKQSDRKDERLFPGITLNKSVVDEARAKLEAFPAASKYYKKIVADVSKSVEDAKGKTTATQLLNNRKATTLLGSDLVIPGAFTRAGVTQMQLAIQKSRIDLSQPDWVMGKQISLNVAANFDPTQMEKRYEDEYADRWKELVRSVQVKPYANRKDAEAALREFADDSSPMKILLEEIKKNTNWSEKTEPDGWIEWIKSLFSKPDPAAEGNSSPERSFKPLFQFVGPKDAKEPPINKYLAAIRTVETKLAKMSSDDTFKQAANNYVNDKDTDLGLKAGIVAVNGMLGSFNENAASQEVAILLRKPLENLEFMVTGVDKNVLVNTWNTDILPAARELEKGYPFTPGGPKLDINKLAAFLSPKDGKFSLFYENRLKRYFEEAGGKYKLKDNAAMKDFSSDFIEYLNKMMALRTGMFKDGSAKFEYSFTLNAPAGMLIDGKIDGTDIKSDNTGSVNLTFPASGSSESGVILNASSGGPAATTAPPTGNSNTAAKPATTSPVTPNSIKYPGTWGLFDFFDASKPTKAGDGEYSLTFNLGGKPVTATIKASGADLFDKAVYRKAPDSMFSK